MTDVAVRRSTNAPCPQPPSGYGDLLSCGRSRTDMRDNNYKFSHIQIYKCIMSIYWGGRGGGSYYILLPNGDSYMFSEAKVVFFQ